MNTPPYKKKKLKKYQLVLIILGSLITCLIIVARVTNGIQFYHIPTTSNEPNIELGDYVIASNLKAPHRFDFITYRFKDSMFGNQIWVHRLCGLPGDQIEIRNDTLFVNGMNADEDLDLKKYYIIPAVDPDEFELEQEYLRPTNNRDSVVALLESKKHDSLVKRGRPQIDMPTNHGDSYIENIYHQNWNANNFGPFVVPLDKYFVLGDNRLNARDSRYIGPISISQYIGTVIGK
jgi:signal peptidase I